MHPRNRDVTHLNMNHPVVQRGKVFIHLEDRLEEFLALQTEIFRENRKKLLTRVPKTQL